MPSKDTLVCYFGCPSNRPLHRFPNPKTIQYNLDGIEKFAAWKSVLTEQTKAKGDNYIYNIVRFCNRHFSKGYVFPNGRITRNAVPTLNLVRLTPGTFEEEYLEYEVLEDLDEFSTFDNDTPEHTETQLSTSETQLSTSEIQLSTSEIQLSTSETQLSTSETQLSISETQPFVSETQPSTSKLAATCQPSAPLILNSILPHEPSGSHPLTAFPTTTPKQAVGYRKHYRAVDPKTVLVNKLKRKLEKLTIKYKNQRKQLLACRKVSMSLMKKMTIMDKLPQDVRTFTKLQLKGTLKPKGRRFTNEEKTMALTILKESPTAFQLLRSMFVLPSKRSLQKMSTELKSQNVSL